MFNKRETEFSWLTNVLCAGQWLGNNVSGARWEDLSEPDRQTLIMDFAGLGDDVVGTNDAAGNSFIFTPMAITARIYGDGRDAAPHMKT